MKVSDLMNQNNYMYRNIPKQYRMNNNDRFIGGGFLAPFLLGGITGGLLAPSFYPRPYPVYPAYPPYPVYQVPYTQSNQYYYYN